MGWWMIVWMVVFWGGLIALIVWGIKKLTERGNSTPKRRPLDIAKERYAKGEISREEFEQIKKDLS
jgi:putative membrane protein